MKVSGFTNKFKVEMLAAFFIQGEALPANFYIALITDDVVPGPGTGVMGELTEIAEGNGYVQGGMFISRDAVDFPSITEDSNDNEGIAEMKALVFTAIGGPIPSSGKGARYAVLIGTNAIIEARKVYAWFDLEAERILDDTDELSINGMSMKLSES